MIPKLSHFLVPLTSAACLALSCQVGRAQVVLSDNFNVTGGNSPGTGYGSTGINYEIASRLSGSAVTANPGMTLIPTSSNAKAASAYSITNNELRVADVANVGSLNYSADGATQFNFSSFLEGQTYEINLSMTLGDTEAASRRFSFFIADAASPSGGVGGANYGFQVASSSTSGGPMSVYQRVSAAASPSSSALNQQVLSGLDFNTPIAMRLLLTDSADYTPGVYASSYELYINDLLVMAGFFRFADSDRYLFFDIAPNTGPASYDNFSVVVVPEPGSVAMMTMAAIGAIIVLRVRRARS